MGKRPERTTYGGMAPDGVVRTLEGQRGQWTLRWAVDGFVQSRIAGCMKKETSYAAMDAEGQGQRRRGKGQKAAYEEKRNRPARRGVLVKM